MFRVNLDIADVTAYENWFEEINASFRVLRLWWNALLTFSVGVYVVIYQEGGTMPIRLNWCEIKFFWELEQSWFFMWRAGNLKDLLSTGNGFNRQPYADQLPSGVIPTPDIVKNQALLWLGGPSFIQCFLSIIWLWFIMAKSRPRRAWRNHIGRIWSCATYRNGDC